jgi:hypothetical protein
MVWMLEERRGRRSDDRHVALRYQLEHAREKGGLSAMVLADDTGMALASSGDAHLCEELAAMAPLMASAPMGLPLSPLLKGRDVSIRTVSVGHERLFLAAIGGTMARDAVVATSAAGLRRILASN